MTAVDPTDLVGAAAVEREARRADRRRQAIESDRLRRLLSGELGRWFAMRVIERAGVFQSTFSLHSDRVSAFKEGERNVGLELLNEITRTCPELWETMTREHAARLEAERGQANPKDEEA